MNSGGGGIAAGSSGSCSINPWIPLAVAITGRASLLVITSMSLIPNESNGSFTATISAPSEAKAIGTAL